MINAKDFYLLRTPLLPLNFLEQFDNLSHKALSEKLKVTFADPYLQEAIYIASPELFSEFKRWMSGELADADKLVLSLFRYLLRMSTRCTPYGLFAGCAVGVSGEDTSMVLSGPDKFRKHCRIDMNYVAELTSVITSIPEIQSCLQYFPNNSMYKIGDRYRYAEYSTKNKFRTYHLSQVPCTAYLEKIIEFASRGATLNSIANNIVDSDINETEAKEFVGELVQSQILVSELEPTVTGEEFFSILVKKLSQIEEASRIFEKLVRIENLLKHAGNGIDKYLQIHKIVKELLPDTNSKDLIQTDMFLATKKNTVSSSVISDLQKHIEKLLPLARPKQNGDLENFKDAFRQRYEDQEVPLVLALDTEAGIGYAGFNNGHADHTPLVDDIFTSGSNQPESIGWSKLHEFQLRKLHTCLYEGSVEIVLTDKDLDELKADKTLPIPDSLYLMGSILGKNGASVDAGDYQFELSGCSGPSVATLLARFCHGDKELSAKVKECLREEEQFNPEIIYAEVVHLPEARAGNILQRPQLRDYEIVYLGNGSVPLENQIPLTDLMVSVRKNRVMLRSIKLNKQVVPRLSTAHNFVSGSLPAYKFLGDLQFQQLHSSLAWRWNNLSDEPFLPRVRYGKVILSKRTWVLQKKDYPELNGKKGTTEVDYKGLFGKMQERLHLPKYVVIVEGDNELLINMQNETSLQILAGSIVKKEKVVLQEFLTTEDKCFVEGQQGRYTNEIIIPFKKDGPPNTEAIANRKAETNSILRTFLTGSEWLYVKIYCGTNSAERLLKEVIKPVVHQLEAAGTIDRWFFVRYNDPEHHIRIRFHHATNGEFWKEVLSRLYEMLKDGSATGLLYKMQTETYDREIERYRIETMDFSEKVFYYDSEAVIDFIDLLEGEEGEQFRWLLAARGVDMLLNDFEYRAEDKAALLKKLQKGFFTEFGGDKALSSQLNDKYREHMQMIRSFMDGQKDMENGIEEAVALFTIRSMNITNALKNLKSSGSLENPDVRFAELLPSYIHMFLNRIFLSNQRKHELVIYHFLSKYYDSQLAIRKSIALSEMGG